MLEQNDNTIQVISNALMHKTLVEMKCETSKIVGFDIEENDIKLYLKNKSTLQTSFVNDEELAKLIGTDTLACNKDTRYFLFDIGSGNEIITTTEKALHEEYNHVSPEMQGMLRRLFNNLTDEEFNRIVGNEQV